MTLSTMAVSASPSKARRSVHISYRMQPSAQMSLLMPYGLLLQISGDR